LSSSAFSLTLVIPGLFGPQSWTEEAAGIQLQVPNLGTLLARGRSAASEGSTLEELLLPLFGVKRPAGRDWPVAGVGAVAECEAIPGTWWARADPVFLRLDRDRLHLLDGRVLELATEEAEQLVAELAPVFTERGWKLLAPDPHRWYVQLVEDPRIETRSLDRVVARHIAHHLPDGEGASVWCALFNEVQMAVHECAVNTRREQRGEPPVNSLWFWGAGAVPALSEAPWESVWTGEPLGMGLAQLCGVPCQELPDTVSRWLADFETSGRHLMVFEELRSPAIYGDFAQWREALERIDREWFGPLRRALGRARIARVELLGGNARAHRFAGPDRWRFWKRRRPLTFF
jgi:hypothetical protein